MTNKKNNSIISIFPLLIFVFIFLSGGIYFDDFYSLPTPLVAFVGVLSAFFIYKSSFTKKLTIFLKGAGSNSVLTMCVIMLFAGAFSAVTTATGSVESIVNLGLRYVSPSLLPVGVFVVASFLSFSTGTSVGTIVTLAPIVLNLTAHSGVAISLVGASLLSGAMFGDNLSLISDTTITATQSMGCKMNEKMKANAKIALPAAFLTILILIFVGFSMPVAPSYEKMEANFNIFLIFPYVLVVLLSLFGVNVFISLFSGTIFAGIIGFSLNKFSFLEFLKHSYAGFESMTEIFLLFFFTGGLAALVEYFGGIQFLMNLVRNRIKTPKTALLGIGALVSLADLCIANNTVSILIVSKISKKIAHQFNISPRDGASVLDIFSCYMQGIIPYGAQVLALMKFSEHTISYPQLILNSFYLHLLLISTLFYIGRYIRRGVLHKP